MNTILLMVLFSTPESTIPHQEPGFAPRVVASMDLCLIRRDFMTRYLGRVLDPGIRFKVYCVEDTTRAKPDNGKPHARDRHPN